MLAHISHAHLTATAHDNDAMHETLSEDDVLSAEQIVDALDRKRRQLDDQIERYKLLKDQEYKAHEHWLKKTARQRDLEPETTAHNGGLNGFQLSSPPSESDGLEPDLPKADRSDGGSTFDKRRVEPVIATASGGEQGFEAMAEQQQDQRSPVETAREREAEFAGVFTPSFLPLLDGSTDAKIGDVASEQPSLYIKDETLASPDASIQPADAAPLSSATNDPFTKLQGRKTEPPRLAIVSSSSSEQMESKHGRSASSDISLTSRRSSFKSPHQTPRSPKRVMFDIGNTVVSPSTSPLLERNNKPAPLMKKSKRAGENGEEQFEIVKKKPLQKHKKHGHHHHKNNSSSSSSRKGHGAAEDGRNLTADAAMGFAQGMDGAGQHDARGEAFVDDFERVSVTGDEDQDQDLFSFDEDLDLRREQSAAGGKEKKWGGDEAGLNGAGDEEGDAVDGEDAAAAAGGRAASSSAAVVVPLTGSSPHAGSLPIEIRWPGRRSADLG